MQMLCCCERVGPIRGCFPVLMALLLRRTLRHQCCLGLLACRCFAAVMDALPLFGPLSCRCFAAVSVLAPSADALSRRWSCCLGGGFVVDVA
ncbi:hypothetical protein BDA96_01G256000 [Sorghum bicolor]|uniref:Secreted protein n=1 Tax=Sorghum bicolor TaxID=4558 RepID=A0A921S2R5_SORBI|nr:hypothetical protein BDA96_01G256000 [Sorghum bicolor]